MRIWITHINKVALFIIVQIVLSVPLFAQEFGYVTGGVDCYKQSPCSGIAVLWKKDPGAVPDPRRFTIPPAAVMPLMENGAFKFEAGPGDYYVGAFLRQSAGPTMGPPRIGDLIYLTPNPAGEAQTVTVVAGTSADVGIHHESWEFKGMTDPAETGISGQVLDRNSQPVAGLLVFAFADADLTASPQAVSSRTDKDGEFLLPLTKPGTFYLRVRKSYQGGQPQPGDYVGVYGGVTPKAISVTEGKRVEDRIIPVLKIPDLMKRKNAPGASRPRISN